MFQAKDKNGTQIFLRDMVSYEGVMDDMGLLGTLEGSVLLIPEEGTVQVQPLKKGGTPVMVQADEVEVTYSLIGKIANLSSQTELQELIVAAETRYEGAVKDAKGSRKRSTSGTTRAAPKKAAGVKVSMADMKAAMAAKKEEDML